MTASIESASPSSFSSTMVKVMFRLGSVGTGLVAIVATLLYAKQESLLYFPEIGGIPRRPASNPRGYRSPSEYNIPFETHMIKCEDGVMIHSWLLLHPHSKSQKIPTILFFHGNAGNIGLRLPNAHQMFNKLNANILMVEYRGYGDSDTVKPTERGLKLDAEAALRFIHTHPEISTDRIFCFGRSLGGAVAFHLAQYATSGGTRAAANGSSTSTGAKSTPLAGILVENTFLSISKMVDQLMPLIAPLKFLVLRMDWNNERVASTPSVTTPILYLAGDKDELVPHNHMTELHERSVKVSSCYARLFVIRNGTHNDSWMVGGKEYFDKIRAFMSHVMLNVDQDQEQVVSMSSSTKGSVGSVSSIDNSDSCTSAGMEVTMGEEGVGVFPCTSSQNAIPIMPQTFVSIAREATAGGESKSNDASNKKQS